MIVVFDTNIWISNLCLKDGASAAMRFYLHQAKARVGLPEVIRLEVERHLRNKIKSLRDSIRSDHKRLLGMVGELKEVSLPSDDQIDQIVASFIADLNFDLLETPLTLKAARSSFMRTIDKIPPSQTSQQFKDGIIWENCLTYAQEDDVTFVTGDDAFYEDRKFDKGLARALQKETSGLPYKLKVVNSIAALMDDIRSPIEVSDELLLAAIRAQLRGDIDNLLERQGFSLAGEEVVTKTFYATEKPDTLFVQFQYQCPCEDVSDAGRYDAVLRVEGDGRYEAGTREFRGLGPTHIGVNYKTADGLENQRSGVYLRVDTMHLGRRTVYHEVRQPLK